jgi:hypothetical protein
MFQAHIYLIQDGNDIGTEIYKFGKSKQDTKDVFKLKRFKGYSDGIIQHNTWLVPYDSVDNIENKIKNHFKNKYISIRGYEWFKGDVKEMKKDIDNIIDNIDNSNNCILTEKAPKSTSTQSTSTQILNTWRNDIKEEPYEFIDEFLSNIFVNQKDINMFKNYLINILDNKKNYYGVLIILGSKNGDVLLDILRKSLDNYYNRYDNPRNITERLIRHDSVCDYSIKVIKENKNCHHVYLWRIDVTNIKLSYEKNNLKYTLCDIKDEYEYCVNYDDIRRKLTKNAILSMLNNLEL